MTSFHLGNSADPKSHAATIGANKELALLGGLGHSRIFTYLFRRRHGFDQFWQRSWSETVPTVPHTSSLIKRVRLGSSGGASRNTLIYQTNTRQRGVFRGPECDSSIRTLDESVGSKQECYLTRRMS